MTELRTKIAEFVDNVLNHESWASTGDEAARHILKLIGDRFEENNALLAEAATQLTANADLMERMKYIGDRVIHAWESLDGESTTTGVTTPLDHALGALRDLLRERPSRAERDSQQFPPGEDAEAFRAHGDHTTARKGCMYCEDPSWEDKQ
jgi:hypothetical protein